MNSCTPAVVSNQQVNRLENVKLLMEQKGLDFAAKDGLHRNALHFALQNHASNTEIIEYLQPKFSQLSNSEPDVYGLTIEKMQSSEHLVKINMTKVQDKLTQYLKLKEQDIGVIDPEGMCNGFAFLAQYYTAIGKQEAFYKVLEGIVEWDGEKNSLEDAQLASELEKKGMPGYLNTADVMEQWTNDIVWFMHTYVNIEKLEGRTTTQSDREEQFSAIQGKNNPLHINTLEKPESNPVTKEILIKKLESYKDKPGTILEFGGGGHKTSAQVLEGGKIFYYDSNFPFKADLFDSAEQLADVIISTKYKMLGIDHDPKFQLEFMAYNFKEAQ